MYNLCAKISSGHPMESQLGTPMGIFDGSGEFLPVLLDSSLLSSLPRQIGNLILPATKEH